MKILKVSFRNLNSLKGDHSIDFEKGLLADAGIFSITGPTGAGKSTILDAITLALFGKAARYESEANPGEMMTRGTGECAAEVLFECRTGRYVAKWTRARSRKKAEGKLQHAKREVSAAASGQILAEKIKEADSLVEALTGLDYQRFLRSVLLAQGRFKEFLDAGDNERGDLLEKITGTEIYSRISQKAYEMQAGKKEQIDSARQQMQGLQLKSEGDLADLNEERCGKEAALLELEIASVELKKKLKLFEDFDQGRKTLTGLKQELVDWGVDDEAFVSERERLIKHEATQPFQENLIKLDSQASQHRRMSEQLAGLSEDVRQKQSVARARLLATVNFVEAAIETKGAEIKASESARSQSVLEQRSLGDWLKEHDTDKGIEAILPEIRGIGEAIRSQHVEQTGQQDRLAKAVGEQQQLEASLSQKEAEIVDLNESLAEARSANEAAVKNYAESAGEQSIDQWRVLVKSQRADVEKARALQSIRQVWEASCKKIEEGKRVLPDLRKVCEKAKQKHDDQRVVYEKEEAVLEDKQRIYEQARLIANFEQQRKGLKSGEACPLCGAEQHPYAEGLGNHEDADRQVLADQKKRVQAGRGALADNAKQVAQAESAFEHQERENKELADVLPQQVEDFEVEAKLIFYSSSIADDEAFDDFLLTLGQRHEQTEARVEKLEMLDREQREQRQRFEKLEGGQRVVISRLEDLKQAKSQLIEIKESLEKGIEGTMAELLAQIGKFNQKLENHGGAVSSADETRCCAEALEARVFAYQKQGEKLESSRGQLKEIERQLKLEGGERKRFEEEVAGWRLKLTGFDVSLGEEMAEVLEISVDESRRRQQCLEVDELARRAEQRVKQLSEDCEQLVELIKVAEGLIQAELGASNFESIDGLRAARLSDEHLRQIKLTQEALKERRDTLQGRIVQTEKELSRLGDEAVPSVDELAVIERDFKELSGQQVADNRRLGEIALLIKQDAEARIEQAGQLKRIEALEKELRPWSELSALIGSASGDKFSKFAQGLTLSQLLQLANCHLVEINERYQIERSSEGELGLQIIDLYQGNVVRPTRSLSGGESFLISLALALGLSDLAGSDTRIESLFIDEGFGTLDSETLDMALVALENLRMSNRTIGIISHVDALKQRISAQVQVSKSNDGFGDLRVVLDS